MGTFTTMAVADAAATPVTHTFVPLKVDGDTAYYATDEGASALKNWQASFTLRGPLPGQSEKLNRAKISVSIPCTVDETVNGVVRTALRDTGRINIELIMPSSAVLVDRKTLRKVAAAILADATVVDRIENLKGSYS